MVTYSSIFKNNLLYLFIFGSTGSSRLCGLPLVEASRGHSQVWVCGHLIFLSSIYFCILACAGLPWRAGFSLVSGTGFPLWWLLFLRSSGPVGLQQMEVQRPCCSVASSQASDRALVPLIGGQILTPGTTGDALGSPYGGFSGCGAPALSSHGSRAQLPPGTWDLPAPGTHLVSRALAGRFFITKPLGSYIPVFLKII